jgi:nitroreductase
MVRAYQPDAVDPRAIERIVSTIRRAPSAGFSQGVRLLVVTEPQRRRHVAEVVASGEWAPWIATAPVHVVVLVREQDYHERYQEPDKLTDAGAETNWPVPYWYVDAGAALMLLLLAPLDEGLAAGFFGALPDEAARVKELLGIPDDIALIGIVTIGYEASDPEYERITMALKRRRRPLEELIRRERWE